MKEIDGLCDDEYREIEYRGKLYKALVCCELTEPAAGAGSETSGSAGAAPARCLAVYRQDFYSGTCAAAEHDFGKGRAYYMACHAEADFLRDFYSDALDAAGVKRLTESRGVGDVILRERDGVLFAMNFSTQPRTVRIGGRDVTLPGYGYEIVG